MTGNRRKFRPSGRSLRRSGVFVVGKVKQGNVLSRAAFYAGPLVLRLLSDDMRRCSTAGVDKIRGRVQESSVLPGSKVLLTSS
ncbi:hypothetical protein J2S53_001193 [Actinopolyspora lacussalsi]|nr:hypothetical protein [Actinopolyspora lacussalsi]